MKKVLFIAIIVLMAFNSCKKNGINLTERLPELKSEWIWTHTTVGGFVGYINADREKPLVIDFKNNNTISIIYNGETIVRNVSFSCEEATDSPYGNYLITLPKEVRSKVAESLGIPESNIVVDGYINLDDAVDLTEPYLTLYITDKDGHNVGYEGGSDFHFCSGFVPNRIVLH
ncbi:MAG: hypothetical protein IJQ11_13610 [Bacteroidales bacterium]|nr:hypothetical protein [Bacteroidales bacterium]MBR0178451.1 hypothetical protein [Bacteroidales bacterium]